MKIEFIYILLAFAMFEGLLAYSIAQPCDKHSRSEMPIPNLQKSNQIDTSSTSKVARPN